MTARRLSSGMLIVMRDGNRIESGNHEALMYKSCLYFWGGNTALFCALLEMRKYSPAASRGTRTIPWMKPCIVDDAMLSSNVGCIP